MSSDLPEFLPDQKFWGFGFTPGTTASYTSELKYNFSCRIQQVG